MSAVAKATQQKNRLMTSKSIQHIRCTNCKLSPIPSYIYVQGKLSECPTCGPTAKKTFGISDIIRDGGWTTQEALDTYEFRQNKKTMEKHIHDLAIKQLSEQGKPITNSAIKKFRANYYRTHNINN
jgi:hypothetical protein